MAGMLNGVSVLWIYLYSSLNESFSADKNMTRFWFIFGFCLGIVRIPTMLLINAFVIVLGCVYESGCLCMGLVPHTSVSTCTYLPTSAFFPCSL